MAVGLIVYLFKGVQRWHAYACVGMVHQQQLKDRYTTLLSCTRRRERIANTRRQHNRHNRHRRDDVAGTLRGASQSVLQPADAGNADVGM